AGYLASGVAKSIEWYAGVKNSPTQLLDQMVNGKDSTLSEEEKAAGRSILQQQRQLDEQLKEMQKQTRLLEDLKGNGGLVGNGG
ncbi:MAG: hypothetical protein IT424_06470, partial [Pirellulales bacterium]|nr:hypothetical protein [Pirellulales bacterium]